MKSNSSLHLDDQKTFSVKAIENYAFSKFKSIFEDNYLFNQRFSYLNSNFGEKLSFTVFSIPRIHTNVHSMKMCPNFDGFDSKNP